MQCTVWGGGFFLRGQPRPMHPKGSGSQRSPIWGFLSIYLFTLYHRNTNFDAETDRGRGLFLGGQPCPNQLKGSGPSAPQFWGFPFIYAYILCRRTTKFNVVANVFPCILVLATPTVQRERNSSVRHAILGVLLYLCLSFKAERPNSA